jgi:hypothetical protein
MLQSQDKKWVGNEIFIHIKQKDEDAINCEDEELVAKRVLRYLFEQNPMQSNFPKSNSSRRNCIT